MHPPQIKNVPSLETHISASLIEDGFVQILSAPSFPLTTFFAAFLFYQTTFFLNSL
jgi:hypothetical protein